MRVGFFIPVWCFTIFSRTVKETREHVTLTSLTADERLVLGGNLPLIGYSCVLFSTQEGCRAYPVSSGISARGTPGNCTDTTHWPAPFLCKSFLNACHEQTTKWADDVCCVCVCVYPSMPCLTGQGHGSCLYQCPAMHIWKFKIIKDRREERRKKNNSLTRGLIYVLPNSNVHCAQART